MTREKKQFARTNKLHWLTLSHETLAQSIVINFTQTFTDSFEFVRMQSEIPSLALMLVILK